MSTEFDNRIGPQRKLNGLWLVTGSALVLVVPLQVATQSFALAFQCTPALGPQLWCLYPPWAILHWASRWGAVQQEAIQHAVTLGFTSATILCLVARLAITARRHTARYLHGSARWANATDLRRAGLLPPQPGLRARLLRHSQPPSEGVYVGAWQDPRGTTHYLRHDGPEHVLAMAPTRSGKGVGLVLPTLLSWPHSAFVLDLKGELFALTAGWRHHHAGQTTLRYEPASTGASIRWNPLQEIRVGTDHFVGDAQNLALMLVDPDGTGIERDHWRSTAMALLVGLILHALERHSHPTTTTSASLAGINALLADPTRPTQQLWKEMLTSPHPVVSMEGRKMLERPEEEGGSVLSTAQRCLALYADPVIAHNTSHSDFHIRDLMHADEPHTLYLVTQPADKDRLMPLVRIFVSMVLRKCADRLEFQNGRPKALYKHRLLMMMDEFVALRKLSILQESLAYVAGYGIKCYLICQDRQQLTSRDYGYGPDETITANCHIQAILRPDKVETAEYISRKTGQTTVSHTQITRSGATIFAKRSYAQQYVQRPLLTADECMRLRGAKTEGSRIVEGGEMLVFAAGMPAARGPQPLYFQDECFAARAAVGVPRGAVAVGVIRVPQGRSPTNHTKKL